MYVAIHIMSVLCVWPYGYHYGTNQLRACVDLASWLKFGVTRQVNLNQLLLSLESHNTTSADLYTFVSQEGIRSVRVLIYWFACDGMYVGG